MQFGTCDNTNNNHLCEQVDDLEISVAYHIEKSENKEIQRNAKRTYWFHAKFCFQRDNISRRKLEVRPKTKGLLTLIPKNCD